MSVLLEQPASLVAYRPNKPTAMVVVANPRVRSTVTRHLWALGVRDVIEASSVAEDAVPRIGNPRDICVADVHLPDGSGLTLLSETRAAGWPNGLALSAADDIGAVRNALAGGVKGYVVTGTRTNVGSPPAPVSRPSARPPPVCTAAPGCPEPPGRLPQLSGREVEVLRLVAEGQSNKAIGVSMGLSALTVKSHLARIARKLGTGDRAGMVAVALRTGIIH